MLEFSSAVLVPLLDRLGSDDQSREHFRNDPASALASSGIAVGSLELPTTCQLPSKTALRSACESLREKDDSKAAMGWFLLRPA